MAKFLNRFRAPMVATDMSSAGEAELWYSTNADTIRYKSAGIVMDIHEGIYMNAYAAGRWYQVQTGTPTTASLANNRVYTVPLVMTRTGTLSGIAMEMSSAWTSTVGNLRLGIYNDDGLTMSPGTLLVDYGLSTATAGVKTLTTTTVLTPGIYWIALSMLGGAGTAGQVRSAQGLHYYLGDSAATPNFNITYNCYYSDTGFSGAFPSSFGSVAGIVGGPRFAVKFSA